MALIGWTVHNRKYLKRKKKKKKQKNTNFPFGIKIEYPTYIQKKKKRVLLDGGILFVSAFITKQVT